MSICDDDIVKNCDVCFEVSRSDTDLTFIYGLTPTTQFYLWVIDKFQTNFKVLFTSGADGSFTIDPTNAVYNAGMFNEFAGEFEVFISTDVDGVNVVTMTLYGTNFDCVLLAISSTTEIDCQPFVPSGCEPVEVTDSDGTTKVSVPSGDSFVCMPLPPPPPFNFETALKFIGSTTSEVVTTSSIIGLTSTALVNVWLRPSRITGNIWSASSRAGDSKLLFVTSTSIRYIIFALGNLNFTVPTIIVNKPLMITWYRDGLNVHLFVNGVESTSSPLLAFNTNDEFIDTWGTDATGSSVNNMESTLNEVTVYASTTGSNALKPALFYANGFGSDTRDNMTDTPTYYWKCNGNDGDTTLTDEESNLDGDLSGFSGTGNFVAAHGT